MPTPFFADLVRELCQGGGTGPLTPTGAVPGHRRFADAVPGGAAFHYSIAGIARPDQWEVGLGRIVDGKLMRDTVAASSNGGAAVDFAVGLKTLALTVGAAWFAAKDAALATLDAQALALAAAVAERQPLSTGLASVTAGVADDLVTVRRDTGWVNIPLSALAFRDAGGRHQLSGPIAATDGTAAAPAIGFSADTNTGLYRPASDVLAIATGGQERLRVRSGGEVGIGVDPGARLHVRPAASDTLALIARLETMNVAGNDYAGLHVAADPGGNMVQLQAAGTQPGSFGFLSGSSERMRLTDTGRLGVGVTVPVGILAVGSDGSQIGLNGGTLSSPLRGNLFYQTDGTGWNFQIGKYQAGAFVGQLAFQDSGQIRPGADNSQTLGNGSYRWSVVYAGTGTINTCDAREKSWRGGPDAAERRAAQRIAAELGFFQWNDAIAAKGSAAARLHVGVRAQRVWAIMADEGLIEPLAEGRAPDSRYAFLCHDEWPAEPDGSVSAGDRFGVRPDQLALFLVAGLEARIAALEAAA